MLLDPGLGKTSITYAACKVLKNKGMFKGALVLAPLRPTYSVWPTERDGWAEFAGFSVGILHGDRKDEVLNEDHDFYVMNFEGIEWLFGAKAPKRPERKHSSDAEAYELALRAWKVKHDEWSVEAKKVKARLKRLREKTDTLVVDELSKLRNSDSIRYKCLKPHLGKFARRWGLTGSPAANSLLDLFGQCYILDLGRALGPYITHYRNKFFDPSGFGGFDWKPKPDAEKLIYKSIKPLMLRMEAADYLELPQLINVPIYVDLPLAARKIYDDMEDELFATLEGREFMAVNAASASMKCEQIANGALYEDKVDILTGLPVAGKRKWHEIHKVKTAALQDLLDELQGSPVLGGYHFGHDLERVVKLLGKDTPRMDVSPKEADRLILRWNNNMLPYLFGHPGSMGHGLNLQKGDAHHVVWFYIPWDFELYDQFIRRLLRQGNKADKVFVYHIVARNTVDEAKMRALSNKFKTQKELLDALKTYRKVKKS